MTYVSPSTRREIKAVLFDTFGSVVDWWFYYDRNQDRKYQRKGLDELKKKWLKEHPGFKDPEEYYRKRS